MDSPENTAATPATDQGRGDSPEQTPDIVPAAGKSAARPSEAERIQALHEEAQKAAASESPRGDIPEGGLSERF